MTAQKKSSALLTLLIILLQISMYIPLPQTMGAPPVWWNDGWGYRKSIVIDAAGVGANLWNFPVLIDLNDPDLASKAQADGDDIVFTAEDGTKLSHEIERYSGGRLTAWVKVPALSSTADTVLYMYYGNPSAPNQEDIGRVWASRYMMVQHLSEGSGVFRDSTWRSNHGTAQGGVEKVSGPIDGAAGFDGSTGYIEVPSSSDISGFTDALTVTAWVRLNDLGRRQSILHKFDNSPQMGWFLEYRPDEGFAFFASPDGANYNWWYASYTPAAGSWHYVSVVWETGKVPLFYIDGRRVPTVRSGTVPRIYDNSRAPLDLGRATHAAGRYLDGAVDEAHISERVLSTEWIRAEYVNQRNPGAFYTVGAEESQGPVILGPIIEDPSPQDNTKGVSVTLTKLSFSLVDPNGLKMDYIVTTNPDVGGGSGSQVTDGRYSVTIGGLGYGVTYTWTVEVTNGKASTEKTFRFTTGQAPAEPSSDISTRYLNSNLGSLTQSELIMLADNIDLITTHPYDSNKDPIRTIRSRNPDVKIISYYNVWTINDKTSNIRLARSEGWVLRDENGKEVYAKGWPNNKIMDVGNQDYRDWLANNIKRVVIDEFGFDGIMGDGTKAILDDLYDISAIPINPRTGKLFTQEEWRDAMIGLVETVKVRMGQDKIYIANGKGGNVGCNKFGFWANQELVEPLIDACDGCLMEGFIRWTTENWRPEYKWVQDTDFLALLGDKGKIPIALVNTHGTLPPGSTYDQVVYYGLATFLMGMRPGYSHFGVSVVDIDYLVELSNIKVGVPIEEYHKRSDVPVYQREFTNSLVLINPTSEQYTVSLGRSYYTLEGTRLSRVTLNEHTGLILLKTTG